MNPVNRINLIISVVMVILGLPAGAIIVSNKALPGDSLYPVKTSIEKIAGVFISPSYQARSDLEIKLIQRRIEENQQLLLSSGSTEGLNLLVAQAQSAAEYIVNSNTSTQAKSAAIKKLKASINQAQQTLKTERQTVASQNNGNTAYVPPKITQTTRPTISQGNPPVITNTNTTTNSPSTQADQTTQTTQTTQDSTTVQQTLLAFDQSSQNLSQISDYLSESDPEAGSSTPLIKSTPKPEINVRELKKIEEKDDEDDVTVFHESNNLNVTTPNTNSGPAGSGSSGTSGSGSGGSAGSGSGTGGGGGRSGGGGGGQTINIMMD